MVVQLGIIAQSVVVDRFTNRMSILNVMDAFESPKFPLFIPEMVFLSILRRRADEPNKSPAELTVFVGAVVVARAPIELDFESGLGARQIVAFQGIPIPSADNLRFQLAIPNQEPFTLEIPVAQSGPGSATLPFQPASA